MATNYSFTYDDQSDIDEFLSKLATSAIEGVQFSGYVDQEMLYNYRANIRTDVLIGTVGAPFYNISFVDSDGNPIDINTYVFGENLDGTSTVYSVNTNYDYVVDTGESDSSLSGDDLTISGDEIYNVTEGIPGLYDADGNSILGYDSNGYPIIGYDADGNAIIGYDANGYPIISIGNRVEYDENGRLIIGYDINGNPITGSKIVFIGYDSEGRLIIGYDENGNPIYGTGSFGAGTSTSLSSLSKESTSSGSNTASSSDTSGKTSSGKYDEEYYLNQNSTTAYFEDTTILPVPDAAGNTANFEFEKTVKNTGVQKIIDSIYKDTTFEKLSKLVSDEKGEWEGEADTISEFGTTAIEYYLGLPHGGHLYANIDTYVQNEAANLAISIQNNMTIADYFANAKSVFISTAMQASGVAQALANIQGLYAQAQSLIKGLGSMFTGWDSSNVLNSMDAVLGNAESWLTQFDSFIDNAVEVGKNVISIGSKIIDRVQAGFDAIKDLGGTLENIGNKVDEFKTLCAEKGFTEAFSEKFLSDSMINTLSNLPVISDVFNVYNTIKSAVAQILSLAASISLPQNLSGIIAIVRTLRAMVQVAMNVKETIMATYQKFKRLYKMISSGEIIGVVMNWAAASLANAIFIGIPPQMPRQYPYTPHYIPPAGGEVAENQKPGSKGGKLDIAPDGSRREVTPEGDIIHQAQGRVQQSSKKALELHSDKNLILTANETMSIKGGNIENVTSGVFSVTAGNVTINGDPVSGNAAINALDTVVTGTKSLTLASAPAKGAIELRAGIIKMTADTILWLSAPNVLIGNPPGGSAAGKSLPCANIINMANASIVRAVGGAGDAMSPAGISTIGAGYIQKLAAVVKLN